jgi:mannose-6-phosphate isomerase-like protein (cupin superfamily)
MHDIVIRFAMLAALLAPMIASAQEQKPAQSGGTTQAAPDAVKYFPKEDVAASFAKGGTLVTESNYKVMTAHRTEDGNVEVHNSYTDVFYIVQGSTDLLTGGKVIGVKNTNPDEPRGDSIEGGQTLHLSAGDSIVIPPGVPHWMKNVQGTLLYFVVKVKKPV